ncbi:hypothetical protein JCM14244_12400 [Venenivibrio stagnispumantis]|uniref:Protein TonB n=1 Tax=Venenivibrio stagnispumantis TaxID=407998 RepID=A0AA46AEZ0_9AQUI|nr:TonB family protein [Venenivibrio stagnispumantis]MCW4573730.1 TonB family protein [Venenivibrio stagnispumantis]SMP15814.1 protein TonB [Venenivibrio stagnispumantis]
MVYTEDKNLLVGVLVSLNIHVFLFLILFFFPFKYFQNQIQEKPIIITVEEIKEEKQKIEEEIKIKKVIEEKKIDKKEIAQKNIAKEEKSEKTQKPETKNRLASNKKIEVEAKNEKIEEEESPLLAKILANDKKSKVEESTAIKKTELSFGEKLSNIGKNVEGTATGREVIYRPPPPKIKTSIIQPSVRAKLWINPDGNVEKVELLTITSDVELNNQIINYLKRWKFNKIPENKTQWATITINFAVE